MDSCGTEGDTHEVEVFSGKMSWLESPGVTDRDSGKSKDCQGLRPLTVYPQSTIIHMGMSENGVYSQ